MVTGVAAFHVRLDSTGNTISSLTGGKGADVIPGPVNVPGRGGDSTAFIAALVPEGASSSDTIRTVAKGAAGAGSGGAKSYGVGIYAIGNATIRTRLTITNGTLSGISDLDIHVDNYTGATTVNTTFSATKLAVETAGNLTVRNFLDVKVYWPNNSTLLGGASVRVDDDGVQAWNAVTPTGQVQWLIITDRVYIRSATTIHDNQTKITVSYTGATFWSDPRLVNMGTSHTEPFGMIDATAPTSSASPLPTYENSRTFGVGYTYSDGNGVGVKTVSLWYRTGAGAWTSYAIQLVPNAGNSFTFTATSDGTYQFYTTATDNAGNSQTAPVGDTGNNTWTIVDTVSPSSRVNPLASYQNALSFVVSWSPDPGVTDILAYTIQYNFGSGWIDWLANTHATTGTFTAGSDGAYAFRSIATDRAGNVEAAPSGNDTWTIVDVTDCNHIFRTDESDVRGRGVLRRRWNQRDIRLERRLPHGDLPSQPLASGWHDVHHCDQHECEGSRGKPNARALDVSVLNSGGRSGGASTGRLLVALRDHSRRGWRSPLPGHASPTQDGLGASGSSPGLKDEGGDHRGSLPALPPGRTSHQARNAPAPARRRHGHLEWHAHGRAGLRQGRLARRRLRRAE